MENILQINVCCNYNKFYNLEKTLVIRKNRNNAFLSSHDRIKLKITNRILINWSPMAGTRLTSVRGSAILKKSSVLRKCRTYLNGENCCGA